MPEGRCSKIERGRCQEGSRWRSARGRIDRQTRKIGSRMALRFNGFRLVRLLGTYTAPGVDRQERERVAIRQRRRWSCRFPSRMRGTRREELADQ